MLGLALLLAFSPVRDATLSAARPGDPAPHLARTPATQLHLGDRAAWRRFQERWGGTWGARWDERDGTPRFLYAPGVADADAARLAADVATLAGIPPGELVAGTPTKRGDRTLRPWTRHHHGAPVLGDQILTVAIGGRIAGVWVQLTPLPAGLSPAPGEVILPVPRFPAGQGWRAPANGARPTLVRWVADGPLRHAVDRAGRVVHSQDTRHFARVALEHLERTIGDAHVTDPAAGLTVEDATGATAITDPGGEHGLGGPLSVHLDGPDLTVQRDGQPVWASGSGDITLTPADIGDSPAVAWHHFFVVWGWLAERWPGHGWLGSNVPANVDISSSACNAYYTSGTINFFVGRDGQCTNFGQIADVLYHEVGHGIHHYILAGGTFAGDVSEGSADYISATLTGDPEVGPGARWNGGPVREIATDRVYPDDVQGEVHADGLIWASFLWNLRTEWVADMGEAAGAQAADRLMLGTLEQGPTLTDLYEAVILADDDDGDLSNGTPHACELVSLLDRHGLGPGPIGVIDFAHAPLGPQASAATGYPVAFTLSSPTSACADLDPDSVALWYATDARPAPTGADDPDAGDTGDTGLPGDPGGYAGWTRLPLSGDGTSFEGTIPRVPATTRIRYFMEAASAGRTQVVRTHGDDPVGTFAFTVGDREAVWCADFEDGAPDFQHGTGLGPGAPGTPDHVDQWEVGVPAARRFGPAAAASGTAVAATDLDGDYRNLNRQYLQGPRVQITDGQGDAGRMLLLSYQRFLTVEDGIYDHARLSTDTAVLYENPATASGGRHVLDTDWTLHDLDLAPHLDAEGGARFTWTLESDPGLEFGGWALDDVCVVRLADVPGHHRRVGLDASDDRDGVTITWTQPWITPLTATVLVRRADSWPEGIDDGVIVDLDTDPVPGEPRTAVDTDAQAGETFHYALFVAAEDDETWFTAVEPGENADIGGVPATPMPGDSGPGGDDSAAPAAVDPPAPGERGCGCTAAPGTAGWLGLLLLPLVARRRRG